MKRTKALVVAGLTTVLPLTMSAQQSVDAGSWEQSNQSSVQHVLLLSVLHVLLPLLTVLHPLPPCHVSWWTATMRSGCSSGASGATGTRTTSGRTRSRRWARRRGMRPHD